VTPAASDVSGHHLLDPWGEAVALKPEPTAPFHSVRYALRVLETVGRHSGGVSDTQIARETGLPPAHLTHLLAMLRHEGYLDQLPGNAFVAGDSLILLSTSGGREQAVRDRLQHTLDELRDTLDAAVYLSRYVDGEIHVAQISEGPTTPAGNEWVDFRSSGHATAIGKCLLGQLDANGRRDHLSRHRLARLTSRTITNEDVLHSRLDAHPATVPVLDLQEYAIGTVCAAVPITAGSTVGCLAVSLPAEQTYRLRSAAETLNKQAAGLLLSLTL
jgi:DNA-binding IclR family transcriptional regulator